MQAIHIPKVDARYWTAILLASIFGTNLGDLYAHESGLGIVSGLAVLAAIVGLAYFFERTDSRAHQVWYWLAIIVIRTGATNIADYMAFRMRLNMMGLCVALAVIIAVLAIWQARSVHANKVSHDGRLGGLPATNARYWWAMLAAGVFGTVLGDVCSHEIGGGMASIVLSALLLVTLLVGRTGLLQTLYFYWLAVAVARTAGTAVGDWLAESRDLNIGLPLCTVLTGLAFVGVLFVWRSRAEPQAVAA